MYLTGNPNKHYCTGFFDRKQEHYYKKILDMQSLFAKLIEKEQCLLKFK